MKTRPEELLRNPLSWLADSGPDDDIAISTRIRLARNFSETPFPIAGNQDALLQVRELAGQAILNSEALVDPMEFELPALSDTEKRLLLERRLISRDMLNPNPASVLLADRDESLAVMINEEDHLRIQALSPGFQLESVWQRINQFDDVLASRIPYAFDPRLGFLTSCPSNLGTGMRASVMLHLPGLVMAGQIAAVKQALGKLGLAVRGFYGEGSENFGNLFQISNQSTLGESEPQILERISSIVKQIIIHEKQSRQVLLDQKQSFLLNQVGRAYGILRHGYMISSEEALNSLSALRLGVDMKMFSSVDIHTVNELFLNVQPSHLQIAEHKELSQEERDTARATLIRETLKAKRSQS
ncbi:MAG: protein arginine kinase [Victivallales bacterium]|jgi:ATP:guanido phosphotransferase